MMKYGKTGRGCRLLAFLLALLLLLGLPACSGSDRPPDDGTPAPPALKGVFKGEQGSFTFSGDGRSVTLDISAGLAKASGLPEGESSGTCVFLFRNEEWRYDKAESFRILIGDKSWQFRNAPGQTNETTLAVYLTDGSEPVLFRKEG